MLQWLVFTVCFILATPALAHGPAGPGAEVIGFIKGASVRSGESIYRTGRTASGNQVERNGGPPWLSMHGGSCGSCHGENGKGGEIPNMCLMVSPAVTWNSLTGDEHKKAGGHEDHKHDPYTLESLRRTLETGFRPGGQRLDECMPLWRLGDDQYRDLVAYLIELNKPNKN